MHPVKHFIAFSLFFLLVVVAKAQPQFAFRVGFNNKNGSPTIANPLSFLSQRALDRRNKYAVAVDESDRPVSPVYVDSVLKLTEGKLHVKSRWLNQCVVLLNDSSKILQLQGKNFITSVQYIAYLSTPLHRSGDDYSFQEDVADAVQKTTGNATYYNNTWNQTSLVHGECLHDLGYKGGGKIIAILDEGFLGVDYGVGFDSLISKGNVIDKHDFVHADTVTFSFGHHGTSVLSTIAGNLPNNYIGAAIDAQVALYVTEDNTSEKEIELDNFVAGVERADSVGADIVSSSLGYNFFDAPLPSLTYSLIDGKTTVAAKAVNIATQKGLLCIVSAGNEGGNSWNYILTPGDADSAFTIGSVDNNKIVASNSGYGPNSAGIQKPDVCALGNPAMILSTGPNPFSETGTSFSTPQIAGYAACLMQAFPTKTPFQIKDAIRRSSQLFANPDPHAGYGVPDLCNAFNILGLEEIKPNKSVVIIPNPSKGAFTISLQQQGIKTLQIIITDMLGKTVLNQSFDTGISDRNNYNFSLPDHVAPGVYSGQLFVNGDMVPFKLLKD